MPNDGGANYVRDKFIFGPVPGKQGRAGASPPVQLRNVELIFRAYLCFILRNTSRPKDAYQVGVLGIADAGKNLLRSLAEIARCSGDLKFLPNAISKE